MVRNRIRWFWHIVRRHVDDAVRGLYEMENGQIKSG
jgi:hypothetical protein